MPISSSTDSTSGQCFLDFILGSHLAWLWAPGLAGRPLGLLLLHVPDHQVLHRMRMAVAIEGSGEPERERVMLESSDDPAFLVDHRVVRRHGCIVLMFSRSRRIPSRISDQPRSLHDRNSNRSGCLDQVPSLAPPILVFSGFFNKAVRIQVGVMKAMNDVDNHLIYRKSSIEDPK